MHRLCDDGNRHVEEEEAESDGTPEKEGDDPIFVIAVEEQARDPPACEQEEDEEVKYPAVLRLLVRLVWYIFHTS